MNLISQILTIAFAVAFALQQSSAVRSFRDYVPVNNPHIKKYHKWGWCVAAVVVIGISPFNLHILINALWYWLVFDIDINKATGKGWDYVGSTAWYDKMLNKIFIHGDAGEAKAIFIVGANIVLNIICSGTYAG
jgi:hypothetical protein